MTGGGLYGRVYDIVRRIPPGRVCSYGRVAAAAGCSARQVGYAMSRVPWGSDVPWHRVVNAKGGISARRGGDGSGEQRRMLENEGVELSGAGIIDMERFLWEPDPPGQVMLTGRTSTFRPSQDTEKW